MEADIYRQRHISQLPLEAAGLTVGELFGHTAMRFAQRTALACGNISYTYAQLDQRVNRLANHLLRVGVQRGDRIAILCENSIGYVELQLACAKTGVVLACLNTRQTAGELDHCIALVAPSRLFVSVRHAGMLHQLTAALPPHEVLDEGFEQRMRMMPDHDPSLPFDPEAGLVILYTSGTTGLPKGALISHRAMLARSLVSRVDGSIVAGRTFVAWAPLYHMGSTDAAFATLITGGKVVVTEGADADQLVELAMTEEMGNFMLLPGIIDRMIAALRSSGRQPRGLRMIGGMADLVPPQSIAEITILLQAPYRNTFGATETGGPPASAGLIPIGVAPTSLRKTQSSHCVVRLVDDADREVPLGEPGEVCLRGPTLFSGYWGADDANAHDFRGGWFHMGDVMVRHADGTLDYVDRRKYLIKSGGENIYPAEIERVLLASPRIADAAVVRRPDARWGEVAVAFVVARDPSLDAEEVLALCRGRIASYKLPKQVVFITEDELPRSTTGKVKRHDLEARLRAAI